MPLSWKWKFIHKLFPYDASRMDIDGAFRVKEDHVPERLYKYRCFTEQHLQALEEGMLYMSPPAAFNDVYDGAVTFDPGRFLVERQSMAEQLAEVEKAKKIWTSGQRYVPQKLINPVQRREQDKIFRDEVLGNEPPERRKIVEEFLHEQDERQRSELVNRLSGYFRSGYSVLSLSELVYSELMWPHYSANHTGFCIEYDMAALGRGHFLRRMCLPVFYSRKMRDATRYLARHGEVFNNLFGQYLCLVKGERWQYEREWRIILAIGPDEAFRPLAMPRPSAVYLGINTSPDNQARMQEMCARLEIPLKKMQADPYTYRLVSTEL